MPSISFAVASHGTVLCEDAFGWADREKRLPASPRTVYAAGSVAKSITGAAVFLLVNRDKLRLDATPEQYGVHVPAYAGRGMTIRQLLTMSAGVPHGWFYDYEPGSHHRDALNRYAISAFPPGRYFYYSNFSFGVLGEVVERTARRPFEDFVGEGLLRPLQMQSSGFKPSEKNLSTGYESGKAVPRHDFEPVAGGGFYTSAHDLALFGNFQLDPSQRLIRPDLMRDMHTVPKGHELDWRYANGWGVLALDKDTRVLVSNGRVLGGSAMLLVLPEESVVIACLTNVSSDATDDLAFQFANVFSSGFLARLESLRKQVEAAEAPQPFRVNESMRGAWVGTMRTPTRTLPAGLRFAKDQSEIRVGNRSFVPIKELRIEQGFVMGEADISIDLPETRTRTTKLELQLQFIDGKRFVGAASTVSTGDLPGFSLPAFISLVREKH
ncbi:MAG: beta-lactamase family protein [Acidobacteria bacterium]|nr:beta-lactamase family protein [Acidobacteriota bacterium]